MTLLDSQWWESAVHSDVSWGRNGKASRTEFRREFKSPGTEAEDQERTHRIFYGKTLNRVTTYANSNDTLLVEAAGNDAVDFRHNTNLISLPTEAANVIVVSATGPNGFRWGTPISMLASRARRSTRTMEPTSSTSVLLAAISFP